MGERVLLVALVVAAGCAATPEIPPEPPKPTVAAPATTPIAPTPSAAPLDRTAAHRAIQRRRAEEREGTGEWIQRESAHFRLRCNSAEEVARRCLGDLEAAYIVCEAYFRGRPRLDGGGKWPIYVFRSADDFENYGGGDAERGAYYRPTSEDTGVAPHRIGVTFIGTYGLGETRHGLAFCCAQQWIHAVEGEPAHTIPDDLLARLGMARPRPGPAGVLDAAGETFTSAAYSVRWTRPAAGWRWMLAFTGSDHEIARLVHEDGSTLSLVVDGNPSEDEAAEIAQSRGGELVDLDEVNGLPVARMQSDRRRWAVIASPNLKWVFMIRHEAASEDADEANRQLRSAIEGLEVLPE